MIYVANPVEVNAFVIRSVSQNLGDANWYLTLEDGRTVTATPEMTARMLPKPGDYWVVQADDYVYLNPKDVFQRKYRLRAGEPTEA